MASTDEIDNYLTEILNYPYSTDDATKEALDALAEYSNDPNVQDYLSQSAALDTVAKCKIYNDVSSTITYATTFLLNLSVNTSLSYNIAYSDSVLDLLLDILVERYEDIPYKGRSKAFKVLYNLAAEPKSRLYVGRFPGMLSGLMSCWMGVYSHTSKVRVRAGKTVKELVKESHALLETTESGREDLVSVVEEIVVMLDADDMVSDCLDVLLEMLKALEYDEFREIAKEAAGGLDLVLKALLEYGYFDDDDDDDDDDGDDDDDDDGDDDDDDDDDNHVLKKAKKIWKVLLG